MIFTLFANFCTTETLAYDEQIVEITKDGQVVDTFQGIDAEYVTYKSNTAITAVQATYQDFIPRYTA